MHKRIRRGLVWGAVVAMLLLTPLLASAYDWKQFNGDDAHSGNNTQETTLNSSNIGTMTQQFQVTLPAVADGAPVYLSNVVTNTGTVNMIYVTTKNGYLVALNADTGAQLWSRRSASGPNYTTSSPAIDPNGQYVYSYGLEGKVHKYTVADGVEQIGAGWPQTATLKPSVEKGSSALVTAVAQDGVPRLYVANGGYPGDGGDYQGHVTTIDLNSGAQRVFNMACSNLTIHFVLNGTPGVNDCANVQTAVWARAGIVYDNATDRIYVVTGNGEFNFSSGYNWGDSVVALNPDGTGQNGRPLDSHTPSNYQYLDDADLDLGSTSLALIPPVPGSSYPHLGAQAGKEGKISLINLDAMSGPGGPGQIGGELQKIDVPQGGAVLPTSATWVNPRDGTVWMFTASYSGISGIQVVANCSGTPSLLPRWQISGGSVTSPLIANNVVYFVSSNRIRAVEPTTGQVLWNNTGIGSIHWESPIIANGTLYITDESSKLTAFHLSGAATPSPTVSPTRAATSTPCSNPTNTPQATNTSTRTSTPVPATSTPTRTSTPVPATSTPTRTSTPVLPTATTAPTNTPVVATNTPAMPTATSAAATDTPVAATNTPVAATDTPAVPTDTPIGGVVTPTDCPMPFVDISGNTFYTAIKFLYCRGVVNGVDATHYGPAASSTRGQFAKVVVLGFGIASYTPTGNPDFTDVPSSYFAYAYIESGYHVGILSGYDAATCTAIGATFPCYGPNRAITRAQLTKLVVNAAGYSPYTPTSPTFVDVPTSNVFYVSIETAANKGVINGYSDNTFRPNNNIRRDEMAQIVYKGITTPLQE